MSLFSQRVDLRPRRVMSHLRSLLAVFLLGCCAIVAVLAAPADVARGVAWLQTQVQSNGAFVQASSTATTEQAQCEAATTLLQLVGNNSQLASLISALQNANNGASATETLSCIQLLGQRLGQVASDGEIYKRRTTDGGFSAYAGFSVANALDTAWTLETQLRSLPPAEQTRLLGWLQSKQSSNGSFQTSQNTELITTAVVLRGLKEIASQSTAAASIAKKAATYLLNKRTDGSGWANDVTTTAIVFEALHPYTGGDAAIAASVNSYLLSQQSPDGSWQSDPYVTAVALRALSLTAATPVDPTLSATAATVQGQTTNGSTGSPISGVTVSVTSGGVQVASTTVDANGRYTLVGLPPGTLNVSASLTGFQTTSAAVTLAAKDTAIFSPAMYPIGQAPLPVARVFGRVLNAAGNIPLSGVSVSMSSLATATVLLSTGSDGSFDTRVAAGGLTITYSLAGFVSQVQYAALTDGGAVDAGSVVLKAKQLTSNMRGQVSDQDGIALSGATVTVLGQVATGVTNAAGSYLLTNLSGSPFTVRVSAPNFVARNYQVSIGEPTDFQQNFTLISVSRADPASPVGYVSLVDFAVSQASVSSNTELTASATVSNPTGVTASTAIGMDVKNERGETVADLPAFNAAGLAFPLATFGPGESAAVQFKWNTAAFPAGQYTLVAKLVEPGSRSASNPIGVVTDSRSQSVQVLESPRFTGALTANPPVLRAGTTTPVRLSALIQNSGNVILPQQLYKLSIVDTRSGALTHTQTISGAQLPLSQLLPLQFADWLAQGAGSFRIELVSPSVSGSLVTASLFIGEASTATFSVDRRLVPTGNQVVRGSVKVSGADVANGSISDPLAPLVQAAVVKAVNFADNFAYNHYVSDLKCFACHVQTQALVGGERNLRFAPPLDRLKRSALMDAITKYIREDGSVPYEGEQYLTTNTSLALWAAKEWHEPKAVASSTRKMADYLVSRQRTDGSWLVDYQNSWWRNTAPITALNLMSFTELKKTVAANGPPTTPVLKQVAIAGLPYGDARFSVDEQGNVYLAFADGSLIGAWKIDTLGNLSSILTGIQVTSVRPIGAGRLIITARTGIFIREANGTLNRISTQDTWDAIPYGMGGEYLVSPTGINTAQIMSSSGTLRPLFQSTLFETSISSIRDQADGSFVAATYRGKKIIRFSSTGSLLDIPVPILTGRPTELVPYKEGYLVSTETGLTYYNKDWVGERLTYKRTNGVVQLPDGRIWVSIEGKIYEVEQPQVDAAAFTQRLDTAVQRAGGWLADGNAIDASNNIDVAFRLMGLGKLKEYYKGTPRSADFDASIQQIGSTLRSRQRPDGGWEWVQGRYGASDSMVTAMVGLGLDTLNPSKDSPEVRKTIEFLLSRQQADGSWISENAVSTQSIKLIPSTWVEIYLPTLLDRLGGIDAGLNVTFPANIGMSNPSATPTSVVQQADGSTDVKWQLTGVTAEGRQIDFDLNLQGMQIDESRPAARQAFLEFKNYFVDGTVTASIQVPSIQAASNASVQVSSDKPVYTEIDQASFSAPVTNAGAFARDAQVRLSVLDASGKVVDVLPMGSPVSVPAGASVAVVQSWAVAGVLSGNYQIKAELVTTQGTVYGSATASFVVQAGQAQLNTARINTDRQSYSAAQTVLINPRVGNATSNTAQDNLQAVTNLFNAAGQSVFSKTEAIAQLAPAGQRAYSYSVAASGLVTGNYLARIQLLTAQGSVLAQSTSGFTVLGSDQTGVGLRGQLQATPSVALIGQPVALALNVSNGGNVVLTNLPITLRVIDPQNGTVLASYTQTLASLSEGASLPLDFNWSSMGLDGQVLVAAATASLGGQEIALAQAQIRLYGIAKLSLSPVQLSFGPIYAGERSGAQTITVASIGTAVAQSLTVALSGTDASAFIVSSDSATACAPGMSLPIGASCTLSVSYQAPQSRTHNASVQVGYAGAFDEIATLTGEAKPVTLTGAVQASPVSVPSGQNTNLGYSVSNPAGVSTSAQLSLAVVDPANGQTLSTWAVPVSLGANAGYAGNQTYTTSGAARTLRVVLSQVNGTTTTVLATASFDITQAVVLRPLQSAAVQPQDARVLVLVSCAQSSANSHDGDDHDDEDDDDQRDSRGRQCSPQPEQPSCSPARAQAIKQYLDGLGIVNKVVTDESSFRHEMQCGGYNTYWLSGGASKLDHYLVKELREAVWRGDGLIIDGQHDDRNLLLDATAGVKYRGKLPGTDYSASIPAGSLFTQGTLPTQGQPAKYDLTTGTKEASFVSSGAGTVVPAIVSNRYGLGGTMLFAFDLAAMVTQDSTAATSQLRQVIGTTASQVSATSTGGVSSPAGSPTLALTVGDIAAQAVALSNPSNQTITAQVSISVPTALTYSSASLTPVSITASSGANPAQLSWQLTLAPQQTQQLTWRVRVQTVATATASFIVPVQVFSVVQGGSTTTASTQLQASYSFTIKAASGSALIQAALPAVQALAPSPSPERNAKSRAVTAINSAVSLYNQARYADALVSWINAANEVISITSVNTVAARNAIAMAIEASTDLQCQALACLRGDMALSSTIPPLGTSLTISRTALNSCSAQIKDVPVTAILTNRRTGQTVVNLWDNLTLNANQSNTRNAGWLMQGANQGGQNQAGDWLDGLMTAEWQGHYIELNTVQAQIAPAPICQAGQPVATSRFTPFAEFERMEVRSGSSGSSGSSAWEWGLGANTQTAGQFTESDISWYTGVNYYWTLNIDAAGKGTYTVRKGSSTVAQGSYEQSSAKLRNGNAIRLTVSSASDAGSARVSAGLTKIEGQNVSQSLATTAAGQQSSIVIYHPNLANGTSAEGTVRLDFSGSTPPQGSRLSFTVNAGTAQCQ